MGGKGFYGFLFLRVGGALFHFHLFRRRRHVLTFIYNRGNCVESVIRIYRCGRLVLRALNLKRRELLLGESLHA